MYETVLKRKVVPPLTSVARLFLCILRHFLILGFFCNVKFLFLTWFCEHSTIACEGGGVSPIILIITIEASLRILSDLGIMAEVMEDARLNIVSVREMFNIFDDILIFQLKVFEQIELSLCSDCASSEVVLSCSGI